MKVIFLGLIASAVLADQYSQPKYGSATYGNQPSYGGSKSSYGSSGYSSKSTYGDSDDYSTDDYGDDQGYDNSDDYDSQPSYNTKSSYGSKDSYGSKPSYSKDSSYGSNKPSYSKDTSYGSKPSKSASYDSGSGYATAPSYGKKTTSAPKATTDPVKRHFDQFYDNLQYCTAENALEQCIISSDSAKDCLSEKRINTCSTQFVNSLCRNLRSSTTGSYDNGYFKATTTTCTDAALADSILVYERLIIDLVSSVVVTPEFDAWSFATIKLALSSTRNHADCVIKSFLNYLNGCAKSRVLPKKDLKCLDTALNNGKCEWANEGITGLLNLDLNGLATKDSKFINSALNFAFGILEQGLTTVSKLFTGTTIQDLQYVHTDYDFEHGKSSVNVCTLTAPWQSLGNENGASANLVKFHLPLQYKDADTIFPELPRETTKKETIYSTCDKYYADTKKKYEDRLADTSNIDQFAWQCQQMSDTSPFLIVRLTADLDAECAQDSSVQQCKTFRDKTACETALGQLASDPTRITCGDSLKKLTGEDGYDSLALFCTWVREKIGNAGDSCFVNNGYSIKFLETGETQPVTFTDIVINGEGVSKLSVCKKASWKEPHSCNAHLTQWQQSVTCCKSYETVLRDFQAAWDKKNARNNGNSYGKYSSRGLEEEVAQPYSNDRPTAVPASYSTKECPYEKILTSEADTSGNVGLHGALYPMDSLFPAILSGVHNPTDDLAENALTKIYHDNWETFCSGAFDDGGRVKNWCSNYATVKLYDNNEKKILAAANSGDVQVLGEAPKLNSCYLSESSTYTKLCKTLKRTWELDTVVPILSTKCFPQSCVLAQLAKCADLPEKETGYDYVAQPQPGYTGYIPSYYHRALLALDTVNTGALAMAGFVAGAAVIAIAQVMLKTRTGHGVPSASYQLV
ncbi:hypothetical protein AC1031_013072 [Aphanomyces cochlioides]|nr:hypothetical protein AC1031_013072 [Aphanomyces cochlioides]